MHVEATFESARIVLTPLVKLGSDLFMPGLERSLHGVGFTLFECRVCDQIGENLVKDVSRFRDVGPLDGQFVCRLCKRLSVDDRRGCERPDRQNTNGCNGYEDLLRVYLLSSSMTA